MDFLPLTHPLVLLGYAYNVLTLINAGGGRNHHTPSENRVFLRNGTSNEPGTSL